jgi:hypothetical protein
VRAYVGPETEAETWSESESLLGNQGGAVEKAGGRNRKSGRLRGGCKRLSRRRYWHVLVPVLVETEITISFSS